MAGALDWLIDEGIVLWDREIFTKDCGMGAGWICCNPGWLDVMTRGCCSKGRSGFSRGSISDLDCVVTSVVLIMSQAIAHHNPAKGVPEQLDGGGRGATQTLDERVR
jgi:hypothetical protein